MGEIRVRLDELHNIKERLSAETRKILNEIHKLQSECKHESLEMSEPIELERWMYDLAYQYDKTGKRVIETRHVKCTECSVSWNEMRYTDSMWANSFEWEKAAREGKI
jgi:hypothetical protein